MIVAVVDASNPGDKRTVGVILTVDGTPFYIERREVDVPTNNVAEYMAVKRAAEVLQEMKLTGAIVVSDSQLVVRQLHGVYQVHEPGLKQPYKETLELLTKTASSAMWAPRFYTEPADFLSRNGYIKPEHLKRLKLIAAMIDDLGKLLRI